MEVVYAGTPLTGPTVYERTGGSAWPTSPLLFEQPLIDAAEPYLLDMGNEGRAFEFGCVRRYGSLVDAAAAWSEFLPSLPRTGVLVWTFTSGGQTLTRTMDAWRVQAPPPEFLGLAVRFRFHFRIKNVVVTTEPPTLPDVEMSGIHTIAEDDEGGTVAFDELSVGEGQAVIVPDANIILPNGSAPAIGLAGVYDITATGFKFHLTSPAPAAGYELHYTVKVITP